MVRSRIATTALMQSLMEIGVEVIFPLREKASSCLVRSAERVAASRITAVSLAFWGSSPVEHFGGPDDAGQHVVEIMGNTACQLPDDIHFVGLEQLLFHVFLLGDVHGDAEQIARFPSGIEERDLPRVQDPLPAAFVMDLLFRDFIDRTPLQGVAVHPEEEVRLRLGKKVVVALADQLLAGIAKECLSRLVYAYVAQFQRVLDKDHRRHILHDGGKELLAFL